MNVRPTLDDILLGSPEWKELTSGARLLFIDMCLVALSEGRNTFIASWDHIAKDWGVRRESLGGWFRQLTEAGLIVKITDTSTKRSATKWMVAALPERFEPTRHPMRPIRTGKIHSFSREREASENRAAKSNSPWAKVA